MVDNIEVRQPSLDDVFFSLTGGHLPDSDDGDEDADPRPRRVPAGTASSTGE
jgi:hypothetical protein